MVVSATATHRKQLARALELLGQVDAPIVGITVNGVGRGDPQAFGYQYSYKTYAKNPQKRQPLLRR
jgi:Mrp family chromosome partitioning ATPase